MEEGGGEAAGWVVFLGISGCWDTVSSGCCDGKEGMLTAMA